jgi:hypothetical protein
MRHAENLHFYRYFQRFLDIGPVLGPALAPVKPKLRTPVGLKVAPSWSQLARAQVGSFSAQLKAKDVPNVAF